MKAHSVVLLLLLSTAAFAFEPPANSELVLDDRFDRADLGKGWNVQYGSWTVADGTLKASQLGEDNHSAAARRILETGDAIYQFRFQFTDDGEGFHFGFDPKRGALDKKGHLFSVIVAPSGWKLVKHVDKNRPKEDPNEILDSGTHSFAPGAWFTLRVTASSNSVTAEIDGVEPLTGSHSSFSVPKPTLVFRALGDGVRIDDLKVWIPAE